MNTGLKLLVEEPCYDIEPLIEEQNSKSPSTMYITGPFLMAEKKNKNGRIYSLNEMTQEVNRYTRDMIERQRSLGELNHPASVEINPERACHMVTEFKQNGNMFMGKSKILNTPMGQLTRTLITDGVKLGVSSRALGKLEEKGDHKDVSDLHLICVDVVHDPSVDEAFVDGILESKEWVLKCDGGICQLYDSFESKLETLPKHETEQYLKENIIEFINSLKNWS
jgi:hypothetical protein